MSDTDEEHGHDAANRPKYDPRNVDLPSREPPLRTTAPQTEFTFGQVTTGVAVLIVGLLLTVGVVLVLG